MIQIGGTLQISLKKNKLCFGKTNRSGKAEKQVILALLANRYMGDEERIIEHIVTSKGRKSINKKNLKGIGEIIHNYQFASKENSDFVNQFKSLNKLERNNVLDAIQMRNIKRDEDCKAYDVECSNHRELIDIGVKQYEKLERIHSMMELDPKSKLHLWTDPTIKFTEKQKTRLSKKEKKELRKEHRKSLKKTN